MVDHSGMPRTVGECASKVVSVYHGKHTPIRRACDEYGFAALRSGFDWLTDGLVQDWTAARMAATFPPADQEIIRHAQSILLVLYWESAGLGGQPECLGKLIHFDPEYLHFPPVVRRLLAIQRDELTTMESAVRRNYADELEAAFRRLYKVSEKAGAARRRPRSPLTLKREYLAIQGEATANRTGWWPQGWHMTRVYEVTDEDIERLNDLQLTDLLRRLLVLEAHRLGLPSAGIHVSLKLDVPDGGEDGRIVWTPGPTADPNGWIPDCHALYQVKATEMGPAECGKEVCKKDSTELKPRVAQTISAGGTYILSYGRHCNGTMEEARIAEIRHAFVASNVPNGASAQIRIFDRGRIATWTNEHAAAVVSVLKTVGRPCQRRRRNTGWMASQDL
jgi:hypothetical protein